MLSKLLFLGVSILFIQVNERAGQIIQYDKFYIHEVQDLTDIRNDYVNWLQRKIYGVVSERFLLIFMVRIILHCTSCTKVELKVIIYFNYPIAIEHFF